MSEPKDIHEVVLGFRDSHDTKSKIDYFRKNPEEFSPLMKLVLNQEPYPYAEYASWMLTHLIKIDSEPFLPFYERLVDLLFETKNQTLLRNVANIVSRIGVTEYRESDFIDLLIGFIKDHENKVALHVYSIYILIHFVRKYPELKEEVSEIIDMNEEGKTVAYKVAQRNFRKKTKNG